MKTLRRIPGWGVMTSDRACNCRSCYAASVGLTSEAVDNWRGRTKCLLDQPVEKLSRKVLEQMLHFIETVHKMQQETREVTK